MHTEQVTYLNGDSSLAIAVDGDDVATAIQSELNIRLMPGAQLTSATGMVPGLEGICSTTTPTPASATRCSSLTRPATARGLGGIGRDGQGALSYRPAGGEWGANERVDHDPYTLHREPPDIAVDATGNAFVIWRGSEVDNSYAIYSAYRPAGGSWGASG